MSEVKKSEITIVLNDLIEFMDRNNIKAIVKQIDGVAFVNNIPKDNRSQEQKEFEKSTNKPKPKYTTKELLEKSLLYISDGNAQDRCARALIKRTLVDL